MKIQDLIARNAVLVDFTATDKSDLITRMATYLVSLYDLKNPTRIVEAMLAREVDMSTGIGHGVALPHARLDSVDAVYMIVARTAEPLEFQSIDDEPVRLIFMLVSPVNSTAHSKVLSQVSRIMFHEDAREAFLSAPDADAYHALIAHYEDKYGE